MLRRFPVIVAALLLSGPVYAEPEKSSKKEDSSFGSMKTLNASDAQKQAAAWLKGVKDDAETQKKFNAIWDSDRPVIDKVSATLALGDRDAARILAEARD